MKIIKVALDAIRLPNNFTRAPNLFWPDLILYPLIILICFASFNQGDILHTIGCSTALLNGHFLDFYEINTKVFQSLNYLPSTYIVFALWGLPLKLLGFFNEVAYPPTYLLFWYKILTSITYAWCAWLVFKIAIAAGYDLFRAKLATLLWVTSPVAIFSQFIFGQYDIFTLLFVLLGILAYVNGSLIRFTFFFAISLTFKYFPIFIFLPFLVVKEKRILQLIKYAALVGVPVILEIALFYNSVPFQEGVLGFSAANRIFSNALKNLNGIEFNLIFLLLPLILIYAYMQEIVDSKRSFFYGLRFSLLSMAVVFSCVLWHPQWFLIITPFVALLIAGIRKPHFYILLDALFGFLLFSLSFRLFTMNVDQSMMHFGFWGKWNPNLASIDKTHLISAVGLYAVGKIPTLTGIFKAILLSFGLLIKNRHLEFDSGSIANSDYSATVHSLRTRFYFVLGHFLLAAAASYLLTFYK